MIFSVDDIKRDVRIALDQNNSSTPLLDTGDVDTLTLEEIIESKIVDGVRAMALKAPQYMLEGGKTFSGSIKWRGAAGRGSGSIMLPDDYLRLKIFKMSDWDYPVFDAITPDNPLYRMQFSRYEGIKGSPQKPVVAITSNADGMVLEFFSSMGGENVNIEDAAYIPIPKIENGTVDISEKLYRPTIHYIAYLVALTIQNGNLATAMQTICNELL